MKIGYILSLSFKNLRNRKLRSVLTIGGMAIGIGSIVFLVSLGFGLQKLVVSQVTDVEALTVLDVTTGTSTLLAIDDQMIETFRKLDKVVTVSPSMNLTGQAKSGNLVTDTVVYAVDPQFISLENIKLIAGENINTTEKESIISTTLLDLLGYKKSNDIIGKTLSFDLIPPRFSRAAGKDNNAKTIEVKITGVVEDITPIAYISLNTANELDFKDYNLVRMKVKSQDDIVSVRAKLESLGYQVDSVADTVGQIDKIFLTFQIIMAVLGFVAMFVASLGTFNTLTVSLLERTREIGVMKSIGATKKDVYLLFMTESVVISFLGAFLGAASGTVLGVILNFVVNIMAKQYGGSHVDIFYTPLIFLAILFLAVFFMGFATGAYPARRAGKLNPLDAIRYE